MSSDKNLHLDCVLKTHSIELDEAKIGAYRSQRDRIKEALQVHFGSRMYNPINSGSYAKKTAINTSFDMDLAAPFKRDGHKTLKEMYAEVEAFLRTLQANPSDPIRKVTQQRRSINLTILVGGKELDLDIVPARELSEGGYEDTHALNLYDSKADSYVQTNIHLHRELMLKKDKEREVVRLLKAWKTAHNVDMKSFFVELMILEAFDKDSTMADKRLYDRLAGSMAFISDNILTKEFKDPANSRNIVSNTLDLTAKNLLKGTFARMLDDIEKDESKIVHYFPINKEHEDQVANILPKFRPTTYRGGTNSFA